MKITRKEPAVVEVVEQVICDVCGMAYYVNKGWDDMQISEFVRVHTTGGYGSIFGDGENIDVDICQYCFKEHIMDKVKNKQNG